MYEDYTALCRSLFNQSLVRLKTNQIFLLLKNETQNNIKYQNSLDIEILIIYDIRSLE